MGGKRRQVEVGTVFGHWTTLKPAHVKKDKKSYVSVQCVCGVVRDVMLIALNRGRSSSCGCKAHITHGQSGTPLYAVWRGMKDRCGNPNHSDYRYYGGKGVRVCAEWLAFEGFFAWASKDYKKGLTIDRRDSDGNYCPDNCRWTTSVVQAQNRKCKVSVSGFIGVLRLRQRWIATAGLNYKTLHLGTFDTKEEAARARDQFVIDNFDAASPTNFPRDNYKTTEANKENNNE